MSLRPTLTTYFPFELGFPIFKCFRLLILDKDIQKILLQQLFIKKYFSYTWVIMEQKKFEKILNSLYPDLEVMDYTLFDRYDVGEDGKFENKITSAIFVTVKGKFESIGVSIDEDITRMTGIEVVVDKFE
jgi:hypothetical protein